MEEYGKKWKKSKFAKFTMEEFNNLGKINSFPSLDFSVRELSEIKSLISMLKSELMKDNTHALLYVLYTRLSMMRDLILTDIVNLLPDDIKVVDNKNVNSMQYLKDEYLISLNTGRRAAYQFLGTLHQATPQNLNFLTWYYQTPNWYREGEAKSNSEDVALVRNYVSHLTYSDEKGLIHTMPHAFVPKVILETIEFQIHCKNNRVLKLGDEMPYHDYRTGTKAYCDGTPSDSINCNPRRETIIGKKLVCKDEGDSSVPPAVFHFKEQKEDRKADDPDYYNIELLSDDEYKNKKMTYHSITDDYKYYMAHGWTQDWTQEYYEYIPYVAKHERWEGWIRKDAHKDDTYRIILDNSPIRKGEKDEPDKLKVMLYSSGSHRSRMLVQETDNTLEFKQMDESNPSVFRIKITNLQKVKEKLKSMKEYKLSQNILTVPLDVHKMMDALQIPDPPVPVELKDSISE